jgi:hypothetical protein
MFRASTKIVISSSKLRMGKESSNEPLQETYLITGTIGYYTKIFSRQILNNIQIQKILEFLRYNLKMKGKFLPDIAAFREKKAS